MTTTEPYTEVASKARQATEQSVEAWKKGAKAIADRTDLSQLPQIDLIEPVTRYFEYVQKAVDLNRDLATKWAELMNSLTGTVREQAEKASHLIGDQVENVADLATKQAEKAEQIAKEQAEAAAEAEKEQVRLAKQAERAAAREAKQKAREPYEGLTKAELSEKLAERELPKTGTVEELIERLVSADSE